MRRREGEVGEGLVGKYCKPMPHVVSNRGEYPL